MSLSPMDYVTILWSMAAATALLLGLIHGLVWLYDRQASASLAFSIAAIVAGSVAVTELLASGIVRIPVMIALSVLIGAMAVKLSRDIIRASRVARDLTDSNRRLELAASAVGELRRELAHAGRVSMLGQLASALAHELSQPLGAILRNAEAAEMMLARAAPDIEELRAIVTDIHRDDRRAGEVIDRLRALLKRRRMEFEAIAVASLVQDVSSLVRPDAIARHVKLECVIAAGLPMVSGDRVHLSQVLINLIINAMDAMADTARTRRSLIVAARHGSGCNVEVAVTDLGTGIPAPTLARIFEPFFTTKAGGMGMGLAVSRTIIEAHGGRLWAENNASGGATLRFTLPAAEGMGV